MHHPRGRALHFELNWTFKGLVSFERYVSFSVLFIMETQKKIMYSELSTRHLWETFPSCQNKRLQILTLFILQSNVTNHTSLYFKFSILSRYWKILYIHLMSSCRNDVNLICKCNILDSYFLNFFINFKQFNSWTRG